MVLAGALPLTTAQTLPFSAKDWPLPRGVVESSIARKWERANDLPRQLQQTLPFALTDWALPKGADSPLARRWERANDLPRQLQQMLPFTQADWPLAEKLRLSAPETAPLNIAAIRTVVAVSTPFSLLDWPLPKRPLLDVPDWQAVSVVTQLGPTPFAQSNWPIATRTPRAAPPDTPTLNVAAIRTVVVAAVPFAFFDWPVPRKPLAVATDTPPLNTAAIRTVVVATKPFALLDWPLASRLRPTAPETSLAGLQAHVICVPVFQANVFQENVFQVCSEGTGTLTATLGDVTLMAVGGALPAGERVSGSGGGTGGFARGRHALGTCDMCAGVFLLNELKPEIYNLRPTGFLVCEECWDLDNPQLQVGRVPIFDPEVLRNPRTDTNLAESRELWGFNPVGNPSTKVSCQDGTVSVNGLFQFPNREVTP